MLEWILAIWLAGFIFTFIWGSGWIYSSFKGGGLHDGLLILLFVAMVATVIIPLTVLGFVVTILDGKKE